MELLFWWTMLGAAASGIIAEYEELDKVLTQDFHWHLLLVIVLGPAVWIAAIAGKIASWIR